MKIAICDDDKIICEYIKKTIEAYAYKKGFNIDIQVFNSGYNLLFGMNNSFDVLFLDIELKDMTGIEIGKKLRLEISHPMEIIFISAHPEYALDLFKIRPMDFLIKPFNEIDVEKIIDECYSKCHASNEYMTYKSGTDIGRVRYDDILYLSSDLRKILIHKTDSNIIDIYAKLDDISKKLPEQIFWRIHKSYIVNIRKVELFQYETMKLINGEILTISKPYRQDIRSRILTDEEMI